MKLLKGLLIFSIVVLVAVLGLAGYLYATAKVTVTSVTTSGVGAQNNAEEFESVKASLQESCFTGIVFQNPEEWKTADSYAFLTYTAAVSNQCFVPVNRIEIQVVPSSGDIAQLPSFGDVSLESHSDASVSATILTAASTNPSREIVVTYYVWGIPFSLRVDG